jgi:predicted nucleic acid-binding protein
VIQEVLQGFRDERAFLTAREGMLALPCVESPIGLEVIERAVDLFRAARRSGRTVRASADCLIAACAIRNDLEVWHFERDYEAIAAVSPLRQRRL